MHDQVVGFLRDIYLSVDDEFSKHLTSSLFPLRLISVWKQINDSHTRGGATPDPEFGAFLKQDFVAQIR